MEHKPKFNLHLTFGEALENAREFKAKFEKEHGESLYIWEDPRDFYNQRIKISTDVFYPTKTFDANIAEVFDGGFIDKEARAVLLWLIERHKGFEPLQLNQIIVGRQHSGFEGDEEVAIFAYLSREDDLLRDFIVEKAFALTDK